MIASEAMELCVFAGVLAVGQFSPGPDLLLVTRTSLTGGGRAGSWTALGIATGLAVHAAIAVGGTAAMFRAGGWLGETMRWVAAAYLAWLGCLLLRGAWRGPVSGAAIAGAAAGLTNAVCYRRGLLTNLLNPKVALFLAAAGAPFLAGARPWWWPASIWAIIVGEGLVLWLAWAWLLQAPPVSRLHARAARWIDAGFGLALLGLALRLVVP
jgi:threonine efflux protein